MDWPQLHKILSAGAYTPQDIEVIQRAFEFSKQAHKGQKRVSGDPYFSHVFAVALHIAKLKLDASAIAASFLHDTVEDCQVSISTIKQEFGEEIAFLVEGVTKLDNVKFHGEKRRIESLRKMFLAVAQDVRVAIIKLVDRMHNMQTIAALPPEKQHRIALETLELYAPLADRLGIGDIKSYLEDLAFPVIYPEEYTFVRDEMAARVPEGTRYLEHVQPILERSLAKDGVQPLAIIFRTKHSYSIWQKILQRDLDFNRVTDLLALRVIVTSVENCYRTLGIIHSLWRPLPGRIKDYIALPKPNGYRSLHTTVFCEDGRVAEFQIRTKEMHEEAELGVAAHWAYVEAGKPKKGFVLDQDKISVIRQLKDWQLEHSATSSSEEAIESLKIDFFKDRIFVLTPKGAAVDLPEGATPVDFAYHIHSDIGDHMAGVKVNNKMVPFSEELKSGDTVEILTQKNKKPSSDWLHFVCTALARNRVRAHLRKEAEEKAHINDTPKSEKYTVHITAADRVGLLKDISAVFSSFRINIQNLGMNTQTKSFPLIVATFHARDQKQINKLFTKLQAVRGVEEVKIEEAKH